MRDEDFVPGVVFSYTRATVGSEVYLVLGRSGRELRLWRSGTNNVRDLYWSCARLNPHLEKRPHSGETLTRWVLHVAEQHEKEATE